MVAHNRSFSSSLTNATITKCKWEFFFFLNVLISIVLVIQRQVKCLCRFVQSRLVLSITSYLVLSVVVFSGCYFLSYTDPLGEPKLPVMVAVSLFIAFAIRLRFYTGFKVSKLSFEVPCGGCVQRFTIAFKTLPKASAIQSNRRVHNAFRRVGPSGLSVIGLI